MTGKRIVFAGTPEFAVPALRVLIERQESVVAVLTQPDRRAGRGRKTLASAVKLEAQAAGLPVLQPTKLTDIGVQAELASLQADLMVVVAYGLILPTPVLNLPRCGCVNLHASLLPRWRGAAPVARAIEAGDQQTGVGLMLMQRGLDTGPLLAQTQLPIAADDTASSLTQKLAEAGAQLLGDSLEQVLAQTLVAQAQPSEGVTYAHKLTKSEARLDFNQPAAQVLNKIRAFNPYPIAESQVGHERLRIHAAQQLPIAIPANAAPGQIIAQGEEGFDVACADSCLRITQVQREGGRVMPAATLCNGLKLVGRQLGDGHG